MKTTDPVKTGRWEVIDDQDDLWVVTLDSRKEAEDWIIETQSNPEIFHVEPEYNVSRKDQVKAAEKLGSLKTLRLMQSRLTMVTPDILAKEIGYEISRLEEELETK